MTTYSEVVDYMPSLTWGTVLDRSQFPGLPAPMIDAIERLLGDEDSCSVPGCDQPVGWYLDEDPDDSRPRNGWTPVEVVWSDSQQVSDTPDGTPWIPLPVLTLCEDHWTPWPYPEDTILVVPGEGGEATYVTIDSPEGS